MKVNFLTNRLTKNLALGLLLTASAVNSASAQDSEALNDIRRVAERFAMQQIDRTGLSDISASAGSLDSRLRLRDCDVPLETFATSTSRSRARQTVGVRCTGQSPWTLYVPVTISARIEALYTARPLLRGEILSAAAVEVRQVELDKLPGNVLSSSDELDSLETLRPLKAGVPLTLNSVKARQVVRQGQQVVIQASTGGIEVKMKGTAMKSGGYGDLIPVRNSNSGRVVEAAVLNEGTVTIRL